MNHQRLPSPKGQLELRSKFAGRSGRRLGEIPAVFRLSLDFAHQIGDNTDESEYLRSRTVAKSKAHPGFAAVASKIGKEYGSKKVGAAVAAVAARNASPQAKVANPRLNKVKNAMKTMKDCEKPTKMAMAPDSEPKEPVCATKDMPVKEAMKCGKCGSMPCKCDNPAQKVSPQMKVTPKADEPKMGKVKESAKESPAKMARECNGVTANKVNGANKITSSKKFL
jgi:hypothetical protein